jgi:hypothetical protein
MSNINHRVDLLGIAVKKVEANARNLYGCLCLTSRDLGENLGSVQALVFEFDLLKKEIQQQTAQHNENIINLQKAHQAQLKDISDKIGAWLK